MELTKHSRNLLLESMSYWSISKEYVDPIYNYLVYGWQPGSFFTAVFANDFVIAMTRSHPANTIEALKHVSGWIINSCPRVAWGSYQKVDAWLAMDGSQRRKHLQDHGLVYTEQEEIVLALKNKLTVEPVFF